MFADTLPVDVVWSLLCAMSVAPVGFMLGSSCSPCCGPQGCGVADGKPRSDPATEGHWVPSGTWATGVTWTFSSTPSTTDGGTWYFYGSASTSKVGGGATLSEQKDWGNICNWYSGKTTTPSSTVSLATALDKRATRLPPSDAIVHVYSDINTTTTGPVAVKNVYFWNGDFGDGSQITTSNGAHDSPGGCVFNGSTLNRFNSVINGGATFNDSSQNYGTTSSDATVNGGAIFNHTSQNFRGTINGGATFNDSSANTSQTNAEAIVNGGATFNGSALNLGVTGEFATVNGGATFNDSSQNFRGLVNDGAIFNDSSINKGRVDDGATFNDSSQAVGASGVVSIVNGGATFNHFSQMTGIALNNRVNGGATFYDSSQNAGIVNDGATFNNLSQNAGGTVNGGATFNDAACSTRTRGSFGSCPGPFRRIFVAHPTDLPTCNGTAPDGCANAADTCGCG